MEIRDNETGEEESTKTRRVVKQGEMDLNKDRISFFVTMSDQVHCFSESSFFFYCGKNHVTLKCTLETLCKRIVQYYSIYSCYEKDPQNFFILQM